MNSMNPLEDSSSLSSHEMQMMNFKQQLVCMLLIGH